MVDQKSPKNWISYFQPISTKGPPWQFFLRKNFPTLLGCLILNSYVVVGVVLYFMAFFKSSFPGGVSHFRQYCHRTMDSRATAVKVTLIWATLMLLATEADSSSFVMPGCSSTKCGNLTVSFPFGTSARCSLDDSFLITCNESYNPPKAFLGRTEVLDISLDGLMKVRSSIASDCYDFSGAQTNGRVLEQTSYQFRFPISSTRNKFTAIGCDTRAVFKGSEDSKQCVSFCDSVDSVVNGTCSGIGCCQASILPGVKDFSVDVRSFGNHSKVRNFNPCGYAFVVEADAFEFSSLDLQNMRNRTTVPVVLDWSIGNVTCQVARKNVSSYACRALHSECVDASHGLGYRCNCAKGFEGDPYYPDGCQVIDACPEGFEGDGEKNGSGCYKSHRYPKNELEGYPLFYIASGLVIPGLGGFWIFRRRKLKKLAKLRRNTFEMNGGSEIESMLSRQPTLMFRLFTAEQLKIATANYDVSRILSRSCVFGTVYRGELDVAGANKLVTVTSYYAREEELKVFIKKLVSFSQIQHRHVSTLIGCCLETQVPLFVHEFVSVHTLSDYIIDNVLASSLSWDSRLRIAAETAGALSYLHSGTGLPIIHGNLSSLTISLHNGSVKIHDVAFTNYCDSSAVLYWMGASGHLDPEYLHSGQWTVKSDVYSFGVVLAELLTGKRSINFFRVNEYFVSSFERDHALLTILDNRIAIEGKIEQLAEVGKLAKKCLSDSSVDRPTMEEVEAALASIIRGRSPSSTIVNQKPTRVAISRRLLRRNKSL